MNNYDINGKTIKVSNVTPSMGIIPGENMVDLDEESGANFLHSA